MSKRILVSTGFLFCVLGALACSSTRSPQTSGETHFLASCAANKECGSELACICGLCTRACDATATCTELSERSRCEMPPADDARCSAAAPTPVCSISCTTDSACADLGGKFSCRAGHCQTTLVKTVQEPRADAGSTSLGDAGNLNPLCLLPPDTGACDMAAVPRIYYDPARGRCEPFMVACSGNANNFENYDACAATCGGPLPVPCSVDATDPSLPGVVLHLESDRCTIEYGQSQTFNYRVTVDAPIQFTFPDSTGSCGRCGTFTTDPTAFAARTIGEPPLNFYSLVGGGCCAPTTAHDETLQAGTYDAVMYWLGRKGWDGASDTPAEPLGQFFPPGSYGVTVAIKEPGLGMVTATLPIEIVPRPFPPGTPTACETNGQVYASGERNIPALDGCNTCQCFEGTLSCTDIACPETDFERCQSGGSFLDTSCSQCGPDKRCEIMRQDCSPSCKSNADCPPGMSTCEAGVCGNVCG